MKRQLTYDQSLHEERTKLRTMTHTKKYEEIVNSIDHRSFFVHKKTMNCFENFPNELIYEIFDYLDGCLLYEAFSNLNQRFQKLLTHPSFRLRVTFISYSQDVLERWCKNVISPNANRIVSFSFNNVFGESPVFTWFPVNIDFRSLQSLTVTDIRPGEVSFLLAGLVFLPRLSSLTISIRSHQAFLDLRCIYQLLFNLSALKYIKLSSDASHTVLSLPRDVRHRCQTIEYLLIDHSCDLNNLLTILSFTPRLTHLVCGKTFKGNVFIESNVALELRYLTNVTFHYCGLGFDQLEIFLRRISSQLQVLRIHTYEDVAYLDADRWETLISQHIPRLRVFQFRHQKTFPHRFSTTPLHHYQQGHRFTSAFWIERKWIFGMSIRVDKPTALVVNYSVQPYKKEEMLDQEENPHVSVDDQTIVSSQSESSVISQTNQLAITDLPESEDNESFMDIIRDVLLFTPITRLNITAANISINRLVDLVRSLPNLDVLVIGSLATEFKSKKYSSVEEVQAFRDVSYNNKITKLILEKSLKLAQVQILIELCPHLQHFEVTCCSDIPPASFLLFILMTNNECLPHLSSIRLRAAHSDRETMFKIQTIMHLENRKHTVKQTNNSIYLRWTVL